MKVKNVTNKAISYKISRDFYTVAPGSVADVPDSILPMEGFELTTSAAYIPTLIVTEVSGKVNLDVNGDGVVNGSDMNLISNELKKQKKKVAKKK